MAPQKMIYVKNEDMKKLDEAMKITKESLSNTVMQALDQFIKVNAADIFEVKRLHAGCWLEMDFDHPEAIGAFKKAFDKHFDDLAKPVDDYESLYDQTFDECCKYISQWFRSEVITFHGKEVFSYTHKNDDVFQLVEDLCHGDLDEEGLSRCASIAGIPLIFLDEKMFEEAILEKKQEKFKPLFEENEKVDIQQWDFAESTEYTVYKTAGGKFLLHIAPNLEHITEVRKDAPYAFPCIADYAILKSLKSDLSEVRGKVTGAIFKLPPRFMNKLRNAVDSEPVHRILDI